MKTQSIENHTERYAVENVVNKYREQWNNTVEDGFGNLMPITIYRVTWKDKANIYYEFWTESEGAAARKKYEIDHGDLIYVNFESWFSYRSDEHDKRFGPTKRKRGWWEA